VEKEKDKKDSRAAKDRSVGWPCRETYAMGTHRRKEPLSPGNFPRVVEKSTKGKSENRPTPSKGGKILRAKPEAFSFS